MALVKVIRFGPGHGFTSDQPWQVGSIIDLADPGLQLRLGNVILCDSLGNEIAPLKPFSVDTLDTISPRAAFEKAEKIAKKNKTTVGEMAAKDLEKAIHLMVTASVLLLADRVRDMNYFYAFLDSQVKPFAKEVRDVLTQMANKLIDEKEREAHEQQKHK